MRDLFFRKVTEVIGIRINNKSVFFSKVQGPYTKYSSIDGLKLDVGGIIAEFPDLKDKPTEEIKKEGVKRFKAHIETLETEQEIQDYITKDLAKHGYKLIVVKRAGFRPEVIK